MTTNLVEAVNFVLRRTRHLSIFVVFSVTFYRLATLMSRMGLRQAKQIEAGHILDQHIATHIAYMGNEFPLIPDVLNKEVPPLTFEMVPDRNLRRHPKGRPQLTRIRNDMDIRETGKPKLYTVCRTFEHNRSTFPHRVYVFGQSSRNAGLEDGE
ncbi:hypothetical protein GOBAR_DD30269 [Gossypium barbadense]|nr:hypothetical protein GOBAR_DD30269 [Gossypium barbadense]